MALQLKYSSRAIQGKPLKRKSTEEETLARKRKYELSRERKFLSVWQSGRPWLKYLEDRKVMVCSWYTVSPSVPRDISFVKGSNNFKIFRFFCRTSEILFGPVNLRHSLVRLSCDFSFLISLTGILFHGLGIESLNSIQSFIQY